MSCNNIFGNIPPASLAKPTTGNTYEITIGPFDKLIVTVQHPDVKDIKTKSEIKPIGIAIKPMSEVKPWLLGKGQGERMVYETDFSIHHRHE